MGLVGRWMRKRLVVVTLLSALAKSQQVAERPSATPELKISTHLVQFGVIARDKSGHAINLTKDDFVLLDRGKPQQVTVFQAESAQPTAAPDALPENTFSDESRYSGEAPKAITVVLLDNLNTLSGSGEQIFEQTPLWLEDHALVQAKERLLGFLRQMDAGDRVAIYGLTDRLHVLCDFTCSREQLLAVVGSYDATSTTARESADPQRIHMPTMPDGDFSEAIDEDRKNLAGINNQRRAELTMAVLTAIAGHVASLSGRKNLLWLTADLPVSGEAIAALLARSNLVAYPVDARGLLPRAPVTDITNADPFRGGADITRSLVPGAVPTGQVAMLDLAADTGGHAFLDSNNLTDAIRQVVEDSDATYTLGFYLPQQEVDGKFHRITVKVAEPGITLVYPRGYFAFRDIDSGESDRRKAFLAAIRSPLDSSAIPVEVRLTRTEQPALSLQVAGTVRISNVPFEQHGDVRTGALDIYAIEQDAAGNVLQQVNQKLNLKLNDLQYQAYLKSGILFRTSVELKPGATVLRVLTQAAGTAAVGCVIVPLRRVK